MEIIINGTFYEVESLALTGREIKELGDIHPVDKLYLKNPDEIVEVKEDEVIFMAYRAVFVSAAAPGYSS